MKRTFVVLLGLVFGIEAGGVRAQVHPVRWDDRDAQAGGLVKSLPSPIDETIARQEGPLPAVAVEGSELFVTIPAAVFQNWPTANQDFPTNTGAKYCDGGPCLFEAAVPVPNGGKIVGIELEACDFQVNVRATLQLVWQQGLEAGQVVLASVDSDTTGNQTPGCQYFLQPLSSPHIADQYLHSYRARVSIGVPLCATLPPFECPSLDTRFLAVRIYYEPQSSGIVDIGSTTPQSTFP